jgi:hypothetical protein
MNNRDGLGGLTAGPGGLRASAPRVIGVGGNGAKFPLSAHSSGRYFVDAKGVPVFLQIDAGWSVEVNLTTSEITTYLTTRKSQGFNAVICEFIEHQYSNQTPEYRNVNGDDPFTTMSPVAFQSPNEPYWQHVDYLVNKALELEILLIVNPCYFGFQQGPQGWYSQMVATSDANLYAYGQFLGNRYPQPNIKWAWGGDDNGDATSRAKQRQILAGIRSVRTSAYNTFHASPDSNSSDVVALADYPNFFDWVYAYENQSQYPFAKVAAAYSATPARVVMFGESHYENENSTLQQVRRQSYSSFLAGARAQSYGNSPVWFFGSGWQAALTSTGATEQSYFAALVASCQWWKLEPKTDNTLVTSSKGGTTAPVCPALASDGTFALIYVPGAQTITAVTTALTGVTGNVRIRFYNPTTGAYSAVAASEAKSGSRSITTSADGVVVIDQG